MGQKKDQRGIARGQAGLAGIRQLQNKAAGLAACQSIR
jgi:hypothetical protein